MAPKPVKPKVMAKPKPQPLVKPKAPTKSRGSNTATQVGNENQREWYNGKRSKEGSRKFINTSTDSNGQMLKVTQKEKDGRIRASSQRSGGKGK